MENDSTISLFDACRHDNVELAMNLVGMLDQRTKTQQSPIHVAAVNGSVGVMKVLLRHPGASKLFNDVAADTPLTSALMEVTPAMNAGLVERRVCCAYLLAAAGANVPVRVPEDHRAAHFRNAAALGTAFRAVEVGDRLDVDAVPANLINFRRHDGHSLLSLAVSRTRKAAVSDLWKKKKADVLWRDEETGDTLAHLAARNKDGYETLKQLKAAGAPLFDANKEGKLPIDLRPEIQDDAMRDFLSDEMSTRAYERIPGLLLTEADLQPVVVVSGHEHKGIWDRPSDLANVLAHASRAVEIRGCDKFAECPLTALQASDWRSVALLDYSWSSGAEKGLEEGLLESAEALRDVLLRGVGLTSFRANWASHALVTRLDVSKNRLQRLEALEVGAMPCLTWVNASFNELTEVGWLLGLSRLSYVDVTGNLITELPRFPQTDLKTIRVAHNLLEDVRSASFIECARSLELVDLSFNLLTSDKALLGIKHGQVLLDGNIIAGRNKQFPHKDADVVKMAHFVSKERLGAIRVVPENPEHSHWSAERADVVEVLQEANREGVRRWTLEAVGGHLRTRFNCLPQPASAEYITVDVGSGGETTVQVVVQPNKSRPMGATFVARDECGMLTSLRCNIIPSRGIKKPESGDDARAEPSARSLALAWRRAAYAGEDWAAKRAAFLRHGDVRSGAQRLEHLAKTWLAANEAEVGQRPVVKLKKAKKKAQKALDEARQVLAEVGRRRKSDEEDSDEAQGLAEVASLRAELHSLRDALERTEDAQPGACAKLARNMTSTMVKLLQAKMAKLHDDIGAEDPTLLESPGVLLDDVAGMNEAKQTLRNILTLPSSFSDVQLPTRIMLFGPPGTGKTMLAKAAATLLKRKCYVLRASDVLRSYVGESEQVVRRVFEAARRQPSIIIIDEMDAMLGKMTGGDNDKGRTVVTEFQQQMDGLKSTQGFEPIVIGITNYPQHLEEAINRRFEKRIPCPLPRSQEEVLDVLTSLCGSKKFRFAGEVLKLLKTVKATGLDKARKEDERTVVSMCKEAADKKLSGADLDACLLEVQERYMQRVQEYKFAKFYKGPDGLRRCKPCERMIPNENIEAQKFSEIPPEMLEVDPFTIADVRVVVSAKKPSVNVASPDYKALEKMMGGGIEKAVEWKYADVLKMEVSDVVDQFKRFVEDDGMKSKLETIVRGEWVTGSLLKALEKDYKDRMRAWGIPEGVIDAYSKWKDTRR